MDYFSPLRTEYIDDGYYILTDDLKAKDGRVVPKGFITDFASVPSFARSIARSRDIPIAATFHDYASCQLAEENIKDKRNRLAFWLNNNEWFKHDLRLGKISEFRLDKFAIAVDNYAKIKVNWFDKHPNKFMKLEDFNVQS